MLRISSTDNENMCDEYSVAEAKKLRRLPRYCEMLVGQTIMSLDSYVAKDWTALLKELKKEYKSGDSLQQLYSRTFLEQYKNTTRTAKDDVRGYCRKFASIAKTLVAAGKLDRYTQVQWFMQGLPRSVCEELFFRKGLDFGSDTLQDFGVVVKKTMLHIENERRFSEILKVDKQTNDRYTALAEQFDKKLQPPSIAEMHEALQPPVIPNSTFGLSKSSERQ